MNLLARAQPILFVTALLVVPSIARADTIYINDYFGDSVEAFDSETGAYLVTVATGLSGPAGMAFDSAGDLFVSDYAKNFITKITPDGAKSVFASGLATPNGLAFDSVGNLYVANMAGNDILKFTPGGAPSVFAYGGGLNGPMGLAFDSAGNLFVANYYGDTIDKFTPDGTGSLFATNGLNYPWDLAFDKTGNLFVANFWGNNIEEFTTNGLGSIFATVGGQSSLRSLAFDSTGNLFATDYANGSIMEFTPNGVGSVFVGVGGNPDGIVIPAVVQVGVGSTAVLAGQSFCVPVTLNTTTGLSALNFTVNDAGTNWTFTPNNVLAGSTKVTAIDQIHTEFTFGPQIQGLQGSIVLGSICSEAPLGTSHFVTLSVTAIGATVSNGLPGITYLQQTGQVIVVGPQPILQIALDSNLNPVLTLYGQPGMTYNLLSTTNIDEGSWRVWTNVTMSELSQSISLDHATNEIQFFEAVQP